MNIFKNIFNRLKRDVKLSFSNPHTFNEVWSITTNGFRILSLSILLVFIIGTGTFFLLNSTFVKTYLSNESQSIERSKLEEQSEKIEDLSVQLIAQEEYIQNIKYILTGQLPVDFPIDSIDFVKDSLSSFVYDEEMTEEEKINLEKVKEDMLTRPVESSSNSVAYFFNPVNGVISQEFDNENHHGMDIVTKKNAVIKTCLPGVILYSAYTLKDGYVIIVEHEDNILSIYKHAQRILKKPGDFVKIGDPIGIVGDTGENSDGPHLHFELWKNLKPVNPEDFIHFTQ